MRLKDRFGNILLLKEKHWRYIIEKHPEIGNYKDRLSAVVKDPDIVKRSRRDKDIFLYYRYYKDIFEGKYLLVVGKIEEHPIVLTCYITDRIKEGDFIWKKD